MLFPDPVKGVRPGTPEAGSLIPQPRVAAMVFEDTLGCGISRRGGQLVLVN